MGNLWEEGIYKFHGDMSPPFFCLVENGFPRSWIMITPMGVSIIPIESEKSLGVLNTAKTWHHGDRKPTIM
jgi:hypothetical protein